MKSKLRQTSSLKPIELEAVYAISKVVAETIDIDEALDEITDITRQVFIFDSAVIYLVHEEKDLEPFFARAIGRGREIGANLPWGEQAARATIETGSNYLHEPDPSLETDRLDQHFYLSLPMLVGGQMTGALVFIRFGGPQYTDDHINLAQFITTHISQLFERKRLVERIGNLEAERRLARMQDDFIAMVSHELKTPLGFIKGYSSTLLRQDTVWDGPTTYEFLTIIDEEADMLSELIENLLDSYRLKSGRLAMKIKPTRLDNFFQGIIDRLNPDDTNLEIAVQVSPSQLEVMADSKRLAQVINNLINNANKYAPNSTLTIQAHPTANGTVHISVSDSGPGIPSQHIEHLFKRFYRVPERSAGVRGTGLGLYICHQIIDSHHGTLTVESELNKGTTFHIQLPAVTENFIEKEENYD